MFFKITKGFKYAGNIYYEDRRFLINLFFGEFPLDENLKLIILAYSGHVKAGKRSVCWVVI